MKFLTVVLFIVMSSSWSLLILTRLYGNSKKVDTIDRWMLTLFLIPGNAITLYVYGTIKDHPEFTKFMQIIDSISDNNFEMFKTQGMMIKFLIILALSIAPIVMIYSQRHKTEFFDVIKPVITTFSIIATILLFLMKTTKGASVNSLGWYICYNLSFGVYPFTLAFAVGEYIVKLEKLKLKSSKKGKKIKIRKRPRRKPKWR